MPLPAKKTAAAPTVAKVNFLDLSMYTAGGGTVPEGNYALLFELKVHQAIHRTTQMPQGAARLGAMVTFYPINEQGQMTGEEIEKFLSMGTNADKCFAPTEDGKSLVAIPNAPYSTFMQSPNWGIFIKSLHDCGLGEAIRAGQLEANDFTGVDGIWVHIQNVPEPEERKSFSKTAKTGEAALMGQAEEERKPGLVPVVSEILENGKPWEGTGGLPTEEAPAEAKPAKAAAKVGPKAVAAKPVVAKKVAAPPPAAEAGDDEDTMVLAVSLITNVIEANPDGVKRLKLRTEVFKAAGDNANAVMATAFKDDDALNGVLNQLGYQIVGADVKPQ